MSGFRGIMDWDDDDREIEHVPTNNPIDPSTVLPERHKNLCGDNCYECVGFVHEGTATLDDEKGVMDTEGVYAFIEKAAVAFRGGENEVDLHVVRCTCECHIND